MFTFLVRPDLLTAGSDGAVIGAAVDCLGVTDEEGGAWAGSAEV